MKKQHVMPYVIALSVVLVAVFIWAVGHAVQAQEIKAAKLAAYYKLHPTPSPSPTPVPTPTPVVTPEPTATPTAAPTPVSDHTLVWSAGQKQCQDAVGTEDEDLIVLAADETQRANNGHIKIRCGWIKHATLPDGKKYTFKVIDRQVDIYLPYGAHVDGN